MDITSLLTTLLGGFGQKINSLTNLLTLNLIISIIMLITLFVIFILLLTLITRKNTNKASNLKTEYKIKNNYLAKSKYGKRKILYTQA